MLLCYTKYVWFYNIERIDEIITAEASDVFGGNFLFIGFKVGFWEWGITPMPALFGVAGASGVGCVGLEEAELVGIGTEPVVDAEAFAVGPIFRFDGYEIEVGAPMVTRCARHRGVAHDGADFADVSSRIF